MTEKISTHLARAVEARRKELGLSPGAFIRETGLTGTALLHLRNGHVRQYQERLTQEVCRVLGWTPDSIDRLLSGKPAKVLPPAGPPQPSTALDADAVETILSAFAGLNESQTKALESIDSRLTSIERHLRQVVPAPQVPRGKRADG